MRTPLVPDASAMRQSLVEHSPSTVMALNVSRAEATSARCRSAGGTCASVVRKPSIVAMFGSIMPDPLAVPPTTNDPRGVSHGDRVFLGKRIRRHDGARRLARPCRARARRAAARIPDDTFSMSRPTPITPVDATSTCSGAQPSAAAVSLVMRSACGHSRVARARVGAAAVDDDASGDVRRFVRGGGARRGPARPWPGWS